MIKRFSESKVIYQNPGAEGRLLDTHEKNDYVFLSIEPGREIAPHALDQPVSFFIAAGKGELTIAGETHLVNKGDMVHAAPGISRGWKNPGGELLEVLVIKEK